MMKGDVEMASICSLNFGILAKVKYSNFAIANLNAIFQAFGGQGQLSFLDIALPKGISFYTFQTMGYIIDVYRGTTGEEHFQTRLFVSFFPARARANYRFDDLSRTLFKEHSFEHRISALDAEDNVGYFKKLS